MSILVPSSGPDSWKSLLADPDKHWRTGYSAKSLAHCWSDAKGLPAEIQIVLRQNPTLAEAQVLIALPEHSVPLPGIGKGSQNDLWALLRTPNALVSMAVEGKVSESFDETVSEWLGDASKNKEARLAGLAAILKLPNIPGTIRYQLVHRTASAIIEAHRFLAAHSVMLVHSFSPTGEWYDDFAAFCQLLGAEPVKDRLIEIPHHVAPTLHVAWVTGNARYRER